MRNGYRPKFCPGGVKQEPAIPQEELGGAVDEKDLSVRPLGRTRGGGPGLKLGCRNAIFGSWRRLSPLFHEGAQIFIFPPS